MGGKGGEIFNIHKVQTILKMLQLQLSDIT